MCVAVLTLALGVGANTAIQWRQSARSPDSSNHITVTAYVPKPGSKAAEALATALESAAAQGTKAGFVDELRQKDAKVLHGIEIIAPNGKTLAIGETP
jgi:hypothetical protein